MWAGSAWEDDGRSWAQEYCAEDGTSVTQRQVGAKIYFVAQEAGGDARPRRVWYCNSRI